MGSAASINQINDSNPKNSVNEIGNPLLEYLVALRTLTPLSNEEQHKLAKRFHKNKKDTEARELLIVTNLRLVVKIAKEYLRPNVELFELIQEGNVGLTESIRRFDPNRNVKFISYAQYWIRAMILNYLMNQSFQVKFGNTRAGRKLFYNLHKARFELRQKGHNKPTPHQVADYLGVHVDEVVMVAAQMDAPPISIDSPIPGCDDLTFGDSMACPKEIPDESAVKHELSSLLCAAFNEFGHQLTEERDQSIWNERMIAEKGMTLKELGIKWGVSKERIRQVETEIRNRFRCYLEARFGDEIRQEILEAIS